MEQQEIFEKFTWKVENFSRLKKPICDEYFVLGGYPWTIKLYQKGYDTLGIYLEVVKTGKMSEGWNRDVKFKLLLFNQLDANLTITKEFHHKFTQHHESQGAFGFIKLKEIGDSKNGFLVNDACIVGAEILVCNSTNENRVYHTVNLISSLPSGTQIGHMELESPSAVSIESTKDCDVELLCAGLGRVLCFLQTRKVKDMNEDACKELKVLWDDLDKFKIYLTWLEPHVQHALEMQSFMEKGMEVEKLNDKLVVLELETMRLKEKLISAEISFDVERELLKAKGVKEVGLTCDLECGTWKG